MRITIFIFVLLLSISSFSQGQKVKIEHADELEGIVIKGQEVRKLRGNVIFSQDNMKLYCDSAYQYASKNSIEAFGRVKIKQGSDITITGNHLYYDGNTKIAKMRKNVVMTDPDMTLYTDHLDYNRNNSTAYYYYGGKIIDTKNTLWSDRGNYHTPSKMLSFKDSVHLKNPEYEIWCDTLQYHTVSKVAYFKGPTNIDSKGTKLFARSGTYNTISGQSHFENQAAINNESYRLMGDSLFYDENNKVGFASGNVELFLKNDSILIYGDVGVSDEINGISKMYGGRPLMKNIAGGDTLYLVADTLITVSDTNQNIQKLLAFNDVQMFKSDLQGVCDSLTYSYEDSSIYFDYDPILWSGESQLVGRKIKIQMANDEIDKMYIDKDAFVVSEDDFKNHNQVKGKNMIAFFKEGNINKLDVTGNGQSIYYVLENDSILTGMNKTICTDMVFYFDSTELSRINFIDKPEARFIPPTELVEPDKFLTGYEWFIKKKPVLEELFPATEPADSLLLKVPEEGKLTEESPDNN